MNIAAWYDPIFEKLLGRLRVLAARAAPPHDGMRVLDIGCGTGAQLAVYHAAGCQVYGVDMSQPMIKVARSKLGFQAVLTVSDAMKIPHPEQTFDLVISSLFLHQLNPGLRTEMLAEAMRVLKSDGKILLIDFHTRKHNTLWGKLTYVFISILEFFAGWEHFSNSRDFLASGGIPDLVAGTGLQIRKSVVVGNGNLGIYLLHQADLW